MPRGFLLGRDVGSGPGNAEPVRNGWVGGRTVRPKGHVEAPRPAGNRAPAVVVFLCKKFGPCYKVATAMLRSGRSLLCINSMHMKPYGHI